MAKRQKVDATLRLRLVDDRIHEEAALLEKLRGASLRTRADVRLRATLKNASPLYISYRGRGFPLKTRTNRRLPAWRSLSPWMRLQIAGLCLAERSFQQFRITPTDDLTEVLGRTDRDRRAYLRDDLRRRLRRTFGDDPWFFFSIEDRSDDGLPVAPHIHGSVLVRPIALPRTKNGELRVRWARIAAKEGVAAAELAYSRTVLRKVLGRVPGPDAPGHHLWSQRPYLGRSNPEWISYALKNMREPSTDLPERRIAITRGLTQEATRLWNLIRKGEEALDQWS